MLPVLAIDLTNQTDLVEHNSLIMRLLRYPAGVKFSTLPFKPEVSGSIPESELRFLFIIVVFTLYLPLFRVCSERVHLSEVLCSRPCALSQPELYRMSPASITHLIIHHCVYLCIYSSLIMGLRSSPGGGKGLGFNSRVRTPFSLYHCCIYLVFTFV